MEENKYKGHGQHRHHHHKNRSHFKYHHHDFHGNDILRLSDIEPQKEVIIKKILGHGAFRKRIVEMGFIKGKTVKVIKNAPLMDPVEYEIMGYNLTLRRKEADLIEVVAPADYQAEEIDYKGISEKEQTSTVSKELEDQNHIDKIINIALVGNPNSGKTSLFNKISGSRERVGNYSGVTVEAKEVKHNYKGYTLNIADLPGTYSITEYTQEELYVREYIINKTPDIVINVVDGSNLERNLFLTTQLIDMNLKVVIALNMYDELLASGDKFDHNMLGKMIGIPFIPTIASKGKGVPALFDKVIEVFEDKASDVRKVNINYGQDIEKAIYEIEPLINENRDITANYDSRYLSIKLLEGDQSANQILHDCNNCGLLKSHCQKNTSSLEKKYRDPTETILADAKYGFVAGALKETYTPAETKKEVNNIKIDKILTHRIFGFPIFLFFLWLIFQSTFTLGSYPMEWIDHLVSMINDTLQQRMHDGIFKDMVVDGIVSGCGSVIIFLPNIVILFFGISLMEDTGYMARVSFIMDKLMHKIGLHGRSFIPMIMGFGCNVPAIMATRTLESRNDRILTMLIIPFMSCSARLPVYVVLIAAFLPAYAAIVLFSMYMIGISIAVISGIILKKTFFKSDEVPYVMELPPYRLPTMKNIWMHSWNKAVEYLKKIGGIILVASIIIWALGYFPRSNEKAQQYDVQIENVKANQDLSVNEQNIQIESLDLQKKQEINDNTYIRRLGRFIEPAVKPLGFDWKIGVSLLTGLAAKEIVVSSMGVLYNVDEDSENPEYGLVMALKASNITPLVAFGLMIFVLIYFPCVGVIATIAKESNWRWAVFTMLYTTSLAWVMAFAIFQIGKIFIGG